MARTVMRFLHRTFRPCSCKRRHSREAAHEDCFHRCALPAGAHVYGLWFERVLELHSPAAAHESTGVTVLWRHHGIALCSLLLRGAAHRRTAAALRFLRATRADSACCGTLQHSCVSPDACAGAHCSGTCSPCPLGAGLPSAPRKLQRHLQREARGTGINRFAAPQLAEKLTRAVGRGFIPVINSAE